MPELKAFRAWRYNTDKIKDPSRVVAPPYDVISPSEQQNLYESSPYNIIRLELGKKTARDTDADNVYTRARRILETWKSEKVLVREDRPTLYVYVQDYTEEGKKKTRTGFYAAMKLDEKAVLKHENTLAGPKEDRLKLLKEVRTNLSPIFGLFEDKKGAVEAQLKKSLKTRPLLDITVGGVRHRLYAETRPTVVEAVLKNMKSKPMFIADGHHRFEVATQYKKLMGKPGPWEHVLAYFSDVLHNPFKIFPTHRLVRSKNSVSFKARLEKLGTLEKMKDLEAILSRLEDCREDTRDKSYSFGVFSAAEGFWLLTLDKKTTASVGKNPVEKLDVSVLHKKILEPHFDIHAVEKSEAIDFTRDPEEAVKKVKDGTFNLAFFLRPTSLSEMLHVSKKGLKMPQKSTYFYPKLLTGLVFHGFDPEN